MEHFSFKGGCAIYECTLNEHLNEELVWATDKRLQLIINTMLFNTNKNLKNKTAFKLKQL